MLKKDAIKYFGSQAEICRQLAISTAAVAKWGEVIPIESALALEILSNNRVPVDRALYPKLASAIETAELRQEERVTV